jgi:hypothetical protein
MAAIGVAIAVAAPVGSAVVSRQPKTIAGAACGATSSTATPDNAIEPRSGRKFVLQFPCDLEAGDDVTVIPEASPVAQKFGCGSRVARPDVVDTRPGYVWDPSRQNPTRIGWGRRPAPGTAKIWVYEGCRDGRIVADVLRSNKGHTEGLEPQVTEAIVRLITSASGGRHLRPA